MTKAKGAQKSDTTVKIVEIQKLLKVICLQTFLRIPSKMSLEGQDKRRNKNRNIVHLDK